MPVYLIEVRGDPKKRLVKADTDAQARKHVVSAKAVTAEQLADHIEAGLAVEKAVTEPVAASQQQGGEGGGES